MVNTVGLSLGICCAVIIFLLLQYLTNFDRFHSKRDRIFRVVADQTINDVENYTMGTPLPLAEALRGEFPELTHVTTTRYNYGGLLTITRDGEQRKFQEEDGIAFVEPAFFEIFDFPWLTGTPGDLSAPNCVAVNETMARKLFGQAEPVGQTIRLDNTVDLKVIGIVRDFPANTDFPFTVLISFPTMRTLGYDMASWYSVSSKVNTYVVLPEGMAVKTLQDRLPALKEKFMPNDLNQNRYKLQALQEMHFDPRYGVYGGQTASRATLWVLGAVGLFLLIAACINFINIATAQAATRAREVGVRKVLGAFRSQLAGQFMTETFFIVSASIFLGTFMAHLALPSIQSLLGIELSLRPFKDLQLLLFLGGLLALVTLFAGGYPAISLSRFRPAIALRNKIRIKGGIGLRRGLIVFQFVISQALIIGTIVVAIQSDYLRHKDLGFEQSAIVVVPLPDNDPVTLTRIKSSLLADNNIRDVSFSYRSPAAATQWSSNVRHRLSGGEEDFIVDLKLADANYLPLHDIQFVAGRNYVANDTLTELVVNESFARHLGLAPHDIIGKMFKIWNKPYLPVVGVVQDFHTQSLHEEIHPCLIGPEYSSYEEIAIRIDMTNVDEALSHIEKIWSDIFPESVFEQQFLEDRIAAFYDGEQRMSLLFRAFAGIAVMLGCTGLFGLVSFMAVRRTKEIGVRKVLGATARNILFSFGREFIILLIISFVVAAPVAYAILQSWLESFVYRIEMGTGIFAMSFGIALLIALLTIGYRAFKVATVNPADSLKYE